MYQKEIQMTNSVAKREYNRNQLWKGENPITTIYYIFISWKKITQKSIQVKAGMKFLSKVFFYK